MSCASWVVGGVGNNPFVRSSSRGWFKTFRPSKLSRCFGMRHSKKDTRRPHLNWRAISSESWRDTQPSLPRRPVHWCGKHPEDPDLPVDRGNDAVAFVIGSAPVEAGRICANTSRDPRLWREMLNQFRSDESQQTVGSAPGTKQPQQIACCPTTESERGECHDPPKFFADGLARTQHCPTVCPEL